MRLSATAHRRKANRTLQYIPIKRPVTRGHSAFKSRMCPLCSIFITRPIKQSAEKIRAKKYYRLFRETTGNHSDRSDLQCDGRRACSRPLKQRNISNSNRTISGCRYKCKGTALSDQRVHAQAGCCNCAWAAARAPQLNTFFCKCILVYSIFDR